MSHTLTATRPASKSTAPHPIVNWMINNGALVGLIIICVGLFIATPHFLTTTNLINVGIQTATVAILAFGMTFVIVSAGIDLAVGSVAACSAMVSAVCFAKLGLPDWLMIIVGLLVGLLAGAISGLAIAYGRLTAFIATLAMMSIARGVTLVISKGNPMSAPPSVTMLGKNYFGIPMPIVMMALSGVICWFILSRTVIGRNMYAIGGNEEAARLSGIPVCTVSQAFSPASQGSLSWAVCHPPNPRPPWAMSSTPLQQSSSAGHHLLVVPAKPPAPWWAQFC